MDRQEVLEKLGAIKSVMPKSNRLGGGKHGYSLNPVLASSEIENFESKYDCELPADYKSFLLEIGNGGAGPSYGVFPFGYNDVDVFVDFCKWEDGYLIDDIKSPFIHTVAWNVPTEIDDIEPDEKDFKIHEEFQKVADEYYHKRDVVQYESKLMNGAIPICHFGCNIRAWLVVNGVMNGKIWIDCRTDGRGIFPDLNTAGEHQSFSAWYMEWLNKLYSECVQKN